MSRKICINKNTETLALKHLPCNVSYACTTSDMNMGLCRAIVAREPSVVVRLMLEMAGWTMNFSRFSSAAFPSSHRAAFHSIREITRFNGLE